MGGPEGQTVIEFDWVTALLVIVIMMIGLFAAYFLGYIKGREDTFEIVNKMERAKRGLK